MDPTRYMIDIRDLYRPTETSSAFTENSMGLTEKKDTDYIFYLILAIYPFNKLKYV